MEKQVQVWHCRKCSITKYVNAGEKFDGICKCCKQPMYQDNNDWWLKGNNTNIRQTNTKPTVTCPYCHSTNTSKITTTSKVAHTALFGIFSMSRNSKQWHCNKCGSDF